MCRARHAGFRARLQTPRIHYDIQAAKVFTTIAGRRGRPLAQSGIAEISEGAVVVFFRDIPELAEQTLHHSQRDGGSLCDDRHRHC